MKIALDLEGVLAGIKPTVFDRSDTLSKECVQKHGWYFGSQDRVDEFMEISQRIWREEPLSYPPLDQRAPEAVKQMATHHDVEIVTGRTGVEENIKMWLYRNRFPVVPVRTVDVVQNGDTKADLDYDVFIDDKPHLALQMGQQPEKYLWLRSHAWNKVIDETEMDRVGRFNSLPWLATKSKEWNSDSLTVSLSKQIIPE